MKNDLDITKPRYSEQILPVPWAFVVSRFRCIQLFLERLSKKLCTRQSRKVIWDMINTLLLTLQLSNLLLMLSFSTCKHRSFEICLKNSELKTTHNTFRDCRVRLFPTTFLELAVYFRDHCHPVKLGMHKTDTLFSFVQLFTAPKMIPNPEMIPKLTPK